MKLKWRPQVFAALVALVILGALGVFFAPEHVEAIVPAAIVGITGLGMKLLEGE